MKQNLSILPILASAASDNSQSILIAVVVSFLIALVVVLILRSGMKNVRAKTEADVYVAGGLELTEKSDRYTHTTTTRTKIQSSSGSNHR